MEEKEPYFQVPKSLFRLRRDGGISLTAFDIYLLMSDRLKLSKKNKWIDENGNLYILYSYKELMEDLNLKRMNSISESIAELEKLNLIKKKRRYNKSNMFYLIEFNSNINVSSNKNNTNENVSIISNKNVISSSNINVSSNTNENVYTNKNNKSKNNTNKNNYNNNNNNNTILRNEIRLLIQDRNIKVENILKYCNDILRIKEVFEYANTNEKHDAWIIACLRDNYILAKKQEKEEVYEKDYSLTAEDVLRGG
ncbi:MAG: replication initiator protein A [Fusobacterium necrophorum]|nr:replication initiator protein A [Fusobacterium necrophorum]